MSKRFTYNLIAVMIVIFYLTMLVILAGCTRYHVQKGVVHNGSFCEECTEVSVWSWREFEQPEISYQRSAESASFDFGAGSATTHSPLEQIGAMTLERMMETYLNEPR